MSVFTYDENPTQVSSPWPRPVDVTTGNGSLGLPPHGHLGLLSDYGVTKLEAEPQDGPIEYKLHLLLRPRKADRSMSTAGQGLVGSSQLGRESEPKTAKLASNTYNPPSPSYQTRQARLVHLTTQLLWRLQQTCPYHAASRTSELVVPQLPLETITSDRAQELSKLIPGLEASRGALYEIGVADDGTLVGLTLDELNESLRTLRVMAASLGCNMEVLQRINVGKGQWLGEGAINGTDAVQEESLWVAEALVTPDPRARDGPVPNSAPASAIASLPTADLATIQQGPSTCNQLRVTLTGPTTSGKSTLLGTLSTGILDDGRGRSRQSSLKHLHEVASGVTSSVAQELIGYNHNTIYNYQHGGIESWIDVHDYTQDGRLVFLLDSAGHTKYRRTILRGVVGWAPHWTILCIAANESEAQLAPNLAVPQDPLSAAELANTAAKAHLNLCLKLGLPFVIAITKLDVVSREVLASTLRPIMGSIRAHGRVAKVLQGQTVDEHLMEIPGSDMAAVSSVIEAINAASSLEKVVPIVLTSAVKGNGIGAAHALLQSLPLPPVPTSHDYIGSALNPEQPTCLFHIEDRFSLPASYATFTQRGDEQDLGTVVGGHLRFGSLSIGDKVLVGPFPSDDDNLCGDTPEGRSSPGNLGLSASHPSSTELGRIAMRNAVSASAVKGQWHHADIVSIRNLRLPVRTLHAGQAGSIGLVIHALKEEPADSIFETLSPAVATPRKGMVLAVPSKHMVDTGVSLQAASELTAFFMNTQTKSFTLGGIITIYIASVRAAARVLRVSQAPVSSVEDDDFALLDQMDGCNKNTDVPYGAEVRLGLLTNREWVELGSRIVILEGAGLDCHVGRVVEIVD